MCVYARLQVCTIVCLRDCMYESMCLSVHVSGFVCGGCEWQRRGEKTPFF